MLTIDYIPAIFVKTNIQFNQSLPLNYTTMNAKKELLDILDNNKIICASITCGGEYYGGANHYELKVNYTDEEYNTFISSLDFEYDNGYGGQELFGTVWLENNKWLERGEYDGSEWWEFRSYPEIPVELRSSRLYKEYKTNDFKIIVVENTWLTRGLLDSGWGNGYVLIPPGHPLHSLHYDNINVEVHGGLTYSQLITEETLSNSHWKKYLTKDDIDYWMIGFDTCHSEDTLEKWSKEAVIAETENLRDRIVNYNYKL